MPEFLKIHLKFNSFLASIAIASFLLIFFLIFTASANAATGINRTINFQGKLVTNPGGTNVSNTSYTIVFTFYNNPNVGQGTALWTETQTVTTTDGIFRVALGSVNPIPGNFNFNWDGLYLGININSNGEMVPRIQMAAVPFAFNSQQVAGLTVQDDSGNASTSGILQIGNTKQVTFSGTHALAFNDTAATTTITLPATGALTLVGQDNSQTITNKIIGTGGLTFNVANNNTDITTSSNQNFTVIPNGSGLIGLNVNSNLLSSLDLRANSLVGGTLAVASVSGTTSFATLVVDQSGLGDIFTASAAGNPLFLIKRNGNVGIGTINPLSGASNSLEVTGKIKSDTQLWAAGSSTGDLAAALYENFDSSATDVNGIAIQSKLANPSSSTTISGIAWHKENGWSTTASTNNASLILTTFQNAAQFEVARFLSTGALGLGTTLPLASLDVRGNIVNGGTLAIASVSGKTSFAALVVDQSGLGDLFAASAAGGTRFVIQRNGNVGILTGASTSATLDVAGTASIGGQLTFRSTFGAIQTTADQQLTLGGNTTGRILLSAFNGQTVSVGGTGSIAFGGYNNCTLKTDGSGNLQCQTDLTGGGGGYSPFQEITGVNGGVIAPNNSTMDFLVGGQSSASANFRVTGKSAPFAGTAVGASVSAKTSFAAFVVDNSGVGDIFTASSSGAPRFVITNQGAVLIGTTLPTLATGLQVNQVGPVLGTSDLVDFVNSPGQEPTVTGPNALSLTWYVKPNTGNTIAAQRINVYNNNTATGGTADGLRIASQGVGGVINSPTIGLLIDSLGQASVGTTLQNAIQIGNNWDSSIYGTNDLRLNAGGNIILATSSATRVGIGYGSNNPLATLDVRANNSNGGTLAVASVSGTTSFASLVVDQSGLGDLFTASAAGGTRFVVSRAGDISATNNLYLAGTTGITLSGNGADLNFAGTGISTITTALNQNFAINPAGFGLVGINTDGINPLANFDVRGNLGTLAVASVSGTTSFAAMVVDNSGLGDLFTASKSGLPLFTIQNNGNVLLGAANATITAPTGLTLQETGDTYGAVALNLQNRNGVNGAMFQQLGTVDLVDFVFKGLVNQRNIRYEDRPSQGSYQIATPEFEIGVAADPTMMISDIGVGIRKGGLLIAGSWNPLATYSATLDVRNLFSGTSAVASISGKTSFASLVVDQSGVGDIFTASSSGASRFVITNQGVVGIGTSFPTLATGLQISAAATGAQIQDLASFSNIAGQEPTIGGVNALQLSWYVKPATNTHESAQRINLFNNNTATGGSAEGLRIASQGVGGVINSPTIGLLIDSLGQASVGTTLQNAIQIGNNWDSSIYGTNDLRLNAGGNIILATSSATRVGIGYGSNNPLATLDVRANNSNGGTLAVASVSGTTSFAAFVVDNSGTGNLITASAAGATKFVVRQDGSVGIGTGTSGVSSGITLDVLGNARIGSSNTSGDDILKSTTSDFTQTGSSITTVESNNIPTVSTSGNQLGLVTDLIGAGASLTAPANGAGNGVGFNIGAGAIAFQRPDSKFILVAGNATNQTRLYDYTTGAFSPGPTLPLNVGAGTNAFQRADGKFMILEGGTNQSVIYTATGSATQNGMVNTGPNLSGVVAAGSQVLRRSDGTYMVILGGGSNATSIYNPTLSPVIAAPYNSTDSGSFTTGPILTSTVTTGSFAFETVYGKWIVGLGGTQTTNIYDPSTNSFSPGPSWSGQTATNTGAGAHVIQRPDYKYEIILGGGSTVTVVYDPVSNTYVVGPPLSSGANTGAHSFQRSNGTWVTVLGGGSTVITNIYDPTANSGAGTFTDAGSTTYLFAGNNAGAGALTFQRPDGKYIIVSGNNAANYTIYDAGWNTTGTWISEQIPSTNISSYSAMLWTGDPQSANNNARLDKSTTDIFVKTAANTTGLASANWMSIANSGNLIGGVVSPPGAIQFQVTFTAPVRSYPQLVTSSINQSNIWGGESFTFNRRSFLSPTIYTLRVSNPLVQYGGLINDPSYGRNFATAGALLEGVVTDNNNQLTLATNRNLPTATNSAGIIIASSSANLGGSAGAGANVIQMPNGQFMILLGGGATATRIYDPDSNTFIPGPAGGACNSGCHSFQLPNGQFFVVLGGGSAATKIYDPASNTFFNGPNLTQTATTGSTTIQRPDGLFIILIGGSNQTSIYDPFLNQITAGPAIPGAAIAAGTSVLRRPDGRIFINIGGQTTTYSYDAAVNSFVMNGTGETHANALTAGAVPYQGPTGRWFIPRGSGNNTSSVIDPILNTIAAGPVMPAGAIANTGALWISRPDGKGILLSGNGTTTSAVYDPEVNGGTGQLWTGPNMPCGVGAGANAFQRPDGSFVLICGGSTASTAILDAGWNLGGSYFSEQIYEPSLSANTSLFWQNASNQGNIYVKYRTSATQAGLGVAAWKDARVSGSQIAYNLNDSWIQVRFDLQGSIPDSPGAKSRVWSSSDTSTFVTYYRTVSAPVLSYWKLMNSTTPTILTLTSNGSNAFRFSADGQAYTAAGGAWNSGGADLAENYTSTQSLEPGDVVVGDRYNSQNVIRSTDSYQSNIMGVVSTKPGFVAGAYTPDSYPIALVGRVPVKISTENGPVHSGDYLTSASIPGYAMKATVAGRVLGTALEDFDPSTAVNCPTDGAGSLAATECGTITAFINLTNYNGQSVELAMADQGFTGSSSAGLSDLQINTGLNSYMNTIAAGDGKILSYLESLRDGNSAVFGSSEVFTGKVVAGEVISPNIIADLITAKTIRADHIEGLEILTNQISSLSNSVAVLGTQSANLTTVSGQLSSTLNLSSLNVDGLATVSGDLIIKGNGLFQGALNVLESITTKNLTVSDFAYFVNDVVFNGSVRFNQVPTFSKDTAGFAVIKQGGDVVQITFDQEYNNTPVVTASIVLDKVGDSVTQKQLEDGILNGNITYVITQRTTKGFVIRLNKPASQDLNFSWVALSVKDAQTSGATPLPSITPDSSATPSAGAQSILNQLNGSAGNGGLQ
jgi:hypothetical protein